VVNGTAALHTALLVAGLEPDDEAVVPALTFIATANAVRYAGAWPVFVDADPVYAQLDAEKLRDFLSRGCVARRGALYNRQSGRRVRAVVPVHVLGHPADMDAILEAARPFGLAVIEDAAAAVGACYKGRPVGGLGDVGCFSFNGNKTLTAGGGGVVVTDDPRLAERARYLTTQAKDDPVEYVHKEVGYNHRLTNLQAALGCAQMELLDEYVRAKRTIAGRYAAALGNLPGLSLYPEAPWAFSACWLSTLRVGSGLAFNSRGLLRHLAAQQIQARPLWQPLHRSAAHSGAQAYRVEVADRLYRESVCLPSSVGLTVGAQEHVARVVTTWLEGEKGVRLAG
jgi:perosamine synthetase